MKDKYEEFKNWFKNQSDISWKASNCNFIDYDDELPFSKFEKELEEKQKKKEVIEAINDGFLESAMEIEITRIYDGKTVEETIYDKLKKRDLIK